MASADAQPALSIRDQTRNNRTDGSRAGMGPFPLHTDSEETERNGWLNIGAAAKENACVMSVPPIFLLALYLQKDSKVEGHNDPVRTPIRNKETWMSLKHQGTVNDTINLH